MIARYWYADTLYASGKSYNAIGKADVATNYLIRTIKISPNQALFHSELATAYVGLALAFNQQKDTTNSSQLSDAAIAQVTKAVDLSPANINFKRIKFSVFVMLSTINPNYLINARDALDSALKEAPTDAKLYYNLALIYARTGQTDLAIQTLSKTIDMKANYREARLAYAILLIDINQKQEAQAQLEYILNKIDPNDSLTKQTLESIK
jgi:tetratricopeptide (TPR) repeat protein